MPDYECHPLWEELPDGVRNLDPAALPVDADLRRDLLDWARDYDATLDPDYPPDSGFESREAEARFDERGRLLWGRLAAALRGVAVVSYHGVIDSALDGP
jgi:hypothetical protein